MVDRLVQRRYIESAADMAIRDVFAVNRKTFDIDDVMPEIVKMSPIEPTHHADYARLTFDQPGREVLQHYLQNDRRLVVQNVGPPALWRVGF